MRRYTTIGMYKDWDKICCRLGDGYQILEEFAASIVMVVQEVKCGIAVCFLGTGLGILQWLHCFRKVSYH